MKNHSIFVILLMAISIPVFVQASEPKETPDVIEIPESVEFPGPDTSNSPMSESDRKFFLSAYNGKLTDVQKFVAKGADVNLQDQKKRTPLILAAHGGHTSVVEFLISEGADVDAKDSGGQTALLYTAKRSFNETAALLINNGADVNIQSKKKGVTALMIAAVAGNVEMVGMLLEHGADPNLTDIFGRSAKLLAEKKGNSDVVDLLPDPPAPESEQE